MSDRAVRISIIVFRGAMRQSPVAPALAAQTALDQAEVLIADGREAPGLRIASFPWVRHLRLRAVPMLKAAAIREARGEFIAILDPMIFPTRTG
jgi:hypothetical protein